MCSPTDIAARARMKVRDFGHYFEVPYSAVPVNTLRLPHPIVDAKTFTVWTPDGTILDSGGGTAWELDQRNGIVKFKQPLTDLPDGVGCSGYYYEWFLDEDLEYASSIMSNQHLYDTDKAVDGSGFAPVECDVIATGAVMQAMWTLLAELAVDIDVSTPEGMSIPATQRFRQVWELAGLYTQTYKSEAAMLGVGLERIEQFTLRRIAHLTNRLVPLMREREVDDHRPPQRVLIPIPTGIQGDNGELVYMPEPPGLAYGGWQTLGTSG